MIEILILIFLTRYIGGIAERKGQPAGRWKLYTVLAWFGFEVAGALISYLIVQNLMMNVLFGMVAAFGGFLFVKSILEKMPDKQDDWIDQIGRDTDLPS
ncbi:MAG: hypothetical protein JNL72_02450 [Flavipsychrobacter sp.]|nr:hypothetical protein [Flavipsychrobacter sp.]